MGQKEVEYQRRYRAKYPDKVRATARRRNAQRWAEDPIYAEKLLQKHRVWIDTHPQHWLWRVARTRAKAKGLEFSIEKSDIIIPSICPCCGYILRRGTPKNKASSPSLDRVDNSRGYAPDNIWVICWRCNSIKKDATPEELRRIADAVDAYGH